MGRIFLGHIGGTRLFSCASCDTILTNRSELISTRFTGATGRAFLFNKAVNLNFSEVQDRVMLTGRHIVRDVTCKNCEVKVGWMYEFATEENQRYKEGKVILERALITESEGFDETPAPVRRNANNSNNNNNNRINIRVTQENNPNIDSNNENNTVNVSSASVRPQILVTQSGGRQNASTNTTHYTNHPPSSSVLSLLHSVTVPLERMEVDELTRGGAIQLSRSSMASAVHTGSSPGVFTATGSFPMSSQQLVPVRSVIRRGGGGGNPSNVNVASRSASFSAHHHELHPYALIGANLPPGFGIRGNNRLLVGAQVSALFRPSPLLAPNPTPQQQTTAVSVGRRHGQPSVVMATETFESPEEQEDDDDDDADDTVGEEEEEELNDQLELMRANQTSNTMSSSNLMRGGGSQRTLLQSTGRTPRFERTNIGSGIQNPSYSSTTTTTEDCDERIPGNIRAMLFRQHGSLIGGPHFGSGLASLPPRHPIFNFGSSSLIASNTAYQRGNIATSRIPGGMTVGLNNNNRDFTIFPSSSLDSSDDNNNNVVTLMGGTAAPFSQSRRPITSAFGRTGANVSRSSTLVGRTVSARRCNPINQQNINNSQTGNTAPINRGRSYSGSFVESASVFQSINPSINVATLQSTQNNISPITQQSIVSSSNSANFPIGSTANLVNIPATIQSSMIPSSGTIAPSIVNISSRILRSNQQNRISSSITDNSNTATFSSLGTVDVQKNQTASTKSLESPSAATINFNVISATNTEAFGSNLPSTSRVMFKKTGSPSSLINLSNICLNNEEQSEVPRNSNDTGDTLFQVPTSLNANWGIPTNTMHSRQPQGNVASNSHRHHRHSHHHQHHHHRRTIQYCAAHRNLNNLNNNPNGHQANLQLLSTNNFNNGNIINTQHNSQNGGVITRSAMLRGHTRTNGGFEQHRLPPFTSNDNLGRTQQTEISNGNHNNLILNNNVNGSNNTNDRNGGTTIHPIVSDGHVNNSFGNGGGTIATCQLLPYSSDSNSINSQNIAINANGNRVLHHRCRCPHHHRHHSNPNHGHIGHMTCRRRNEITSANSRRNINSENYISIATDSSNQAAGNALNSSLTITIPPQSSTRDNDIETGVLDNTSSELLSPTSETLSALSFSNEALMFDPPNNTLPTTSNIIATESLDEHSTSLATISNFGCFANTNINTENIELSTFQESNTTDHLQTTTTINHEPVMSEETLAGISEESMVIDDLIDLGDNSNDNSNCATTTNTETNDNEGTDII